eukprot:2133259-Alexandrium_andersonii.AAC.1
MAHDTRWHKHKLWTPTPGHRIPQTGTCGETHSHSQHPDTHRPKSTHTDILTQAVRCNKRERERERERETREGERETRRGSERAGRCVCACAAVHVQCSTA